MTEPAPLRSDELTTVAVGLAGLADTLRFALEGQGLSLAQHRALAILGSGPVMASDLAARLGITSASVTAMVDRLVDAGLVQRGQDPKDRRRVVHRINANGRKRLAQADAAVVELLRTVLDTVPEAQGARLLEALPAWGGAITRRLVDVFAEHERSGDAVGFGHLFGDH